jgi:hypothetical protein
LSIYFGRIPEKHFLFVVFWINPGYTRENKGAQGDFYRKWREFLLQLVFLIVINISIKAG